jgi:hypothetical protein
MYERKHDELKNAHPALRRGILFTAGCRRRCGWGIISKFDSFSLNKVTLGSPGIYSQRGIHRDKRAVTSNTEKIVSIIVLPATLDLAPYIFGTCQYFLSLYPSITDTIITPWDR